MAHIRLQPIDRENHTPLLLQPLLDALVIHHAQGDEFFIALHQIGHTAFRDAHPTAQQRTMHLGHATVLAKALGAHGGDDVKADLAMGQRIAALLFGTVGPTEQRAAVRPAPTDL